MSAPAGLVGGPLERLDEPVGCLDRPRRMDRQPDERAPAHLAVALAPAVARESLVDILQVDALRA